MSIFLITGMHRSGTSFLARALNILGVDLGDSESLITDDWRYVSENKRGHWENTRLIDLGEKILSQNNGSWDNPPKNVIVNKDMKKELRGAFNSIFKDSKLSVGYKDPRIILYLDAYVKFLSSDFKLIGIFRHPLEVAESLKVRNKFEYEKSINLWKIYNNKLLGCLEKYNGFLLDFDWPKEKLLSELKIISEKLGLANLDISDWYTEDLISSNKTCDFNYELSDEVKKIYSKLKERSQINNQISVKKINFSKDELNSIVKELHIKLQKQGNYFKNINEKNLNILRTVTDKPDPLSLLLAIYYRRDDLQKRFPEVKSGDYRSILTWGLSILKGDVKEKIPLEIQKYSEWYENYLKKEKEEARLKKLKEKVEREQTKAEQLREKVERERSKSEKLEDEVEREQSKSKKLEDEVEREQSKSEKLEEKSIKLESEIAEYHNNLESILQSQGWQAVLAFRKKTRFKFSTQY